MSFRSALAGLNPSTIARPPQNGSTKRRLRERCHSGWTYETCQRFPPAHFSGGRSRDEAGVTCTLIGCTSAAAERFSDACGGEVDGLRAGAAAHMVVASKLKKVQATAEQATRGASHRRVLHGEIHRKVEAGAAAANGHAARPVFAPIVGFLDRDIHRKPNRAVRTKSGEKARDTIRIGRISGRMHAAVHE